MSFLTEFKRFSLKGNVVDMAVGIIIGVAFGKVIASLVKDIIMPPIGVLIGGVEFSSLVYIVQEAQGDIAAVTIKYGLFIQSIVDFIIITLAIFVAIKAMNSLKKKEEEAPKPPPKPSNEEVLLSEIKDLLKK